MLCCVGGCCILLCVWDLMLCVCDVVLCFVCVLYVMSLKLYVVFGGCGVVWCVMLWGDGGKN